MSNKDMKTLFSQNLKRELQEKEWTQKDFSDRMEVPPTTVSDWMSGGSYPRIEKIQKMSEVLGVPTYRLTEDFRPGMEVIIENLMSLDDDVFNKVVEIIRIVETGKGTQDA